MSVDASFSIRSRAFWLFWLLGGILLFAACMDPNELEADAVLVDFRITPAEAAAGTQKDVRAPDGKVYTLVVPKGVRDRTPLKLPPKVAATYPYPLYFRVRVLRADQNTTGDLLNRKKDN